MFTTQLEARRSEEPEPASSLGINLAEKIQVKVRFDYRGTPRPARFFFGGKGSREVAEDLRERKATMWRNVPLQGVQVDDVKHLDMYTVYETSEEDEISYAPLELLATVDSLEDCLRFVSLAEFRRLQVITPPALTLSGREMERLLCRCHEVLQQKLREQEER